jgi:tRNA(fMet)-specific endonuclease VapC
VSGRVAVDTDVFSYLLKQDTRRTHFEPHLKDRELLLSIMVVAEVRRWAFQHGWGARRNQALEDAIRHHVVAPLTATTAQLWAEIYVARARKGRRIGESDCWIAATAIEFNVPIVTNNTRDFEGILNLRVLGPLPS